VFGHDRLDVVLWQVDDAFNGAGPHGGCGVGSERWGRQATLAHG
jgi:hypothetical protein